MITVREGLEMSLVVAILFAYLAKLDRRNRFPAAWGGIVAAAVVCVVAGVSVHLAVGALTGKAEQAVEAALAFTAAGVLTWMVSWMRRNARGISGQLRSRLETAISGSGAAVALVAFVAVAREGFETVLFLTGAQAEGATGAEVVVGGIAGLVVAGLLGVAVYRGGRTIDLGRFFRWTGVVLLLFAAGLFAKGVHEARELLEVDWSALVRPAWTVRGKLTPRSRWPSSRPRLLRPRPRSRPWPSRSEAHSRYVDDHDDVDLHHFMGHDRVIASADVELIAAGIVDAAPGDGAIAIAVRMDSTTGTGREPIAAHCATSRSSRHQMKGNDDEDGSGEGVDGSISCDGRGSRRDGSRVRSRRVGSLVRA